MEEATRHKLVWGWLRLLLGFTQMSLVALAVGALVEVGLRPISWIFVILATTASVASRLIYHGRKKPDDKS